MPPSRRRKPKKSKRHTGGRNRMPNTPAGPLAPVVPEAELFAPLLFMPPELLPLYTPIAILRQHAMGHPATNCVALSYQLAGALGHLGFQAEVVAACVNVFSRQDNTTQTKVTQVGVWDQPPLLQRDGTTNGHVVVWAESFGRLVDLTVGQDETLQRASRHDAKLASPVVLQLPALPTAGQDDAPMTERGPFLLTYLLLPQWADRLGGLWQDGQVHTQLEQGALSVAHTTLDILRTLEGNDPSRRTTAPRLRALLDGDAALPSLPDDASRDVITRLPPPRRLPPEVEQVITELDTECLVTLADDPALGFDQVDLDLDAEASTAGRVPVVLFEPRQAMVMQRESGERYEAQTEGIIQAGMQRLDWPQTTARPVEGWLARSVSGGVELLDATDGSWARGQVTPPAKWVRAAEQLGWVLALYGIQLGVRPPPDSRSYGLADRRAELDRARQAGIVAAGLVRWGGRS